MSPKLRESETRQSGTHDCPECGNHRDFEEDQDGWFSCNRCGLQLEAVSVYVNTLPFTEPGSISGVGHGGPIGVGEKAGTAPVSSFGGVNGSKANKDFSSRRHRISRESKRSVQKAQGTLARRVTKRMIRDYTRDMPLLRNEALFNLEKGWPEPKNREADFVTIASKAHPNGREGSAAACILYAAQRMGIEIPSKELLEDIFTLDDDLLLSDARQRTNRAKKRLHQVLGTNAFREASGNRLDAVLSSAFDRDNRLGPIHDRVRTFMLMWAEVSRPRVLDSPSTYAAAVAYEIAKLNGISLTIVDCEFAFQVSQGFRTHCAEVRDLMIFARKHPGVKS